MKSSFVKMSKFHPLLTDTLPYEVPVLFSNRGFYETIRRAYDNYYLLLVRDKAKGISCKEAKTIEDFVKEDFINNPVLYPLRDKIKNLFSKHLQSYEYSIVKSNEKRRKLSLIHPISQLKICDFYARHEDEILFHTSSSDVSLRHPVKRTSRTFRQHTSLINKLTKEEEQANCNDPRDVLEDKKKFELDDIPNNYFVYKKYRHIHAFYNSAEFLELEQRFSWCLKFDIKRCFDSIYTHSIAWALKGKLYAKNNRDGFGNEIDKLMQSSNWGETHGIPIGSEFSRIFAEILLQKIDQEFEIIIESENVKLYGKKLQNGFDFKIRRYVDDFFIFVNNKEIGEKIIAEYENVLSKYKLFPNQEKYEILSRPFVTKNTAAKQKILPKLKKTLRQFHYIDEQNQSLNSESIFQNVNKCSNNIIHKLIEEIRTIIYDNKIEMMDISNLILSQIKKELAKVLDIILSLKDVEEERYRKQIIKGSKKYLNCILDLSFYVFHLSSRSNTTYGICKICFEIVEILQKLNDDRLTNEIKQKIFSQFLLFFENKKTKNTSLIEFLDIIWVIDELGEKYILSGKRLMDIIQEDYNKLTYFELMVLLSYVKANNNYNVIRKRILDRIRELFDNTTDIFEKADTFMLFFDVIKCPYITKDYKKEILSSAGLTNNKEAIIGFIENRKWFFGWDEKLTLKKLFEIKELQNAY